MLVKDLIRYLESMPKNAPVVVTDSVCLGSPITEYLEIGTVGATSDDGKKDTFQVYIIPQEVPQPVKDHIPSAAQVKEAIDRCDLIAHKHKFTSTWSIFEVTDFNKVPFPDINTVIYRQHWGTPNIDPIVVGEDKSWLSLWRAADELIRLSGDRHHIFIEKFEPIGNTGMYELFTGS